MRQCRFSSRGMSSEWMTVSDTALPLNSQSSHSGSQIPKSKNRSWWARWGSNPRPSGYEPHALTTELQARTGLKVPHFLGGRPLASAKYGPNPHSCSCVKAIRPAQLMVNYVQVVPET